MILWEMYKRNPKSKIRVDIMGIKYTVRIAKYEDDPIFKEDNCVACCGDIDKEILLCNPLTLKSWSENDSDTNVCIFLRETLRYEIIHAFLNECGLKNAAMGCECWANNEEMIDWFAIMAPRIYKAYQICDCLEA